MFLKYAFHHRSLTELGYTVHTQKNKKIQNEGALDDSYSMGEYLENEARVDVVKSHNIYRV
jgi:hypothetical protein